MSLDILESIGALFPSGVARQAGVVLGEPEANIQSALRSGSTTLLAGLMKAGADPVRSRNLFQTIIGNGVDSSIERKLPAILGDRNQFQALQSSGESLIGSIFASRASGVTNALSQVAGVKPSTAASLLATVAPVLMGLIKGRVLQGGLNAGGLSALLLGQRESLERAGLDDRLTGAMGYGNLSAMLSSFTRSDVKREVENFHRPAATSPEQGDRRWVPWALAAAALAAVAAVILIGRSGDRRDTTELAQNPTAERLVLASTSVYFETGQTTLDEADQAAVSGIAQAARASGHSVTLTGYTDASGDRMQNEDIARNRANAVRMALVTNGLPESKIIMKPPTDVTGSGSDTQARRVEISTTP
jgi:outer membrane protein OmpA-like peptidoglycan-associated protein